MKRYELIGRPAQPDAALVEGWSVGQRFEANFTKEQEQALVGAGALRVLGDAKGKASGKQANRSKQTRK